MVKLRFYATKIGREGPNIYKTWDQCKANSLYWPGAVHKHFSTPTQAQKWVAEPDLCIQPPNLRATRTPNNVKRRHDIRLFSAERPGLVEEKEQRALDDKDTANSECFTLSPEQKLVLLEVLKGKSVFFTGSAGTGKSFLLRQIIKLLRDVMIYDRSQLAITASTGIASVNIGGSTIHSWAGIGLGLESAEKIADRFCHNPKYEKVAERWKRVRALIIDEISMIDGRLFDKLDFIAREVRHDDRPFGGIQLIISGDFAQLPPIRGMSNKFGSIPNMYAFQAESWKSCIGTPITLKNVFRQRNPTFVNMLNAMRFADLNSSMIEILYGLSRPVYYDDGIEPTELFPTRSEVHQANSTRLMQLPSPTHCFKSVDIPGVDDKGKKISQKSAEKLLDRMLAPAHLTLKVGAQVMLIKNLQQGELVNGSLGVVVSFCTENQARKWSIEAGSMIEMIENDDGSSPSERQPLPPHPIEDEFAPVWPVVRFTNGRQVFLTPQNFTVVNAKGHDKACRQQVPLILAWALNVHKSQGQTLERLRVDLQRTFEKGQVYVALSRATKLESLQVLNFHPDKVVADPAVINWHKSLV